MNSFSVEKAIDVDVPLHQAYEHWHRFHFFSELRRDSKIRVLNGRDPESSLHRAVPKKRISWKARDRRSSRGVVMFTPRSDSRVRVRLRMAYEADGVKTYPIGFIEFVGQEIERILNDFKSSLVASSIPTTSQAVVKTGSGQERTELPRRR